MKKEKITGIIMAGGLSRRMGSQDKGLLLLKGTPLFKHVAARLQYQVTEIIVNANRNTAQYKRAGYPIVSDHTPGFLGPLSAIQTGLMAARTNWCFFTSCDTPFLPYNLVTRLLNGKANHSAAYVNDGIRAHPLLLLIHKSMLSYISDALQKNQLKVQSFLDVIGAKAVNFSGNSLHFVNINTPEELYYWNSR